MNYVLWNSTTSPKCLGYLFNWSSAYQFALHFRRSHLPCPSWAWSLRSHLWLLVWTQSEDLSVSNFVTRYCWLLGSWPDWIPDLCILGMRCPTFLISVFSTRSQAGQRARRRGATSFSWRTSAPGRCSWWSANWESRFWIGTSRRRWACWATRQFWLGHQLSTVLLDRGLQVREPWHLGEDSGQRVCQRALNNAWRTT